MILKENDMNNDQLKADNAQYIWHPMAHPGAMKKSTPDIIAKGEGCWIWDVDGHKMLDGVTTQEAPALLFGDEDLVSISGERHSPRFKPAWNVELFWADPKFSNHWIVESQTWNHFLEIQSIGILQ